MAKGLPKRTPKKKFANGGKIVGPGTGTSDDIQKKIPSGSYIMPADSTEAIGEENLQGMGQPVEAMVSNGEYELPPEQVHAIGAQTLDQMRNATHEPVAQQQDFADAPMLGGFGFHPDLGQTDQQGSNDMAELPKFAGGGLVTEEEAARMRQADGNARPPAPQASPQPAQQAAAQPPAVRPNAVQQRPPLVFPDQQPRLNAPPATPALPAPQPAAGLPAPQQPGGLPAASSQPAPTAARPAPQAALNAPKPTLQLEGPRAQPAGIDQIDLDNVRRQREMDSHRYRAESAAQDARAATSAQPRTASRPGGLRGLIDKSREKVNFGGSKLAKAGAITSAVSAIAPSMDEDSTARYAERFGVSEPTGDGSVGDIAKFAALRGGGYATDLASTLTLGLVDPLYRDNQKTAGEAAVDLAQPAGIAGGFMLGRNAGKIADSAGRVLTGGRYKGNLGDKLLGNRVTKPAMAIAGAAGGAYTGKTVADEAKDKFDIGAQQASNNQNTHPSAPAEQETPAGAQPASTEQAQPEFYKSGIQKPDMVGGVPTFTNEHVKNFDPNSIQTMPGNAIAGMMSNNVSDDTMDRLAAARAAAVARGEPVPGVGGLNRGGGGTRFNVIRDQSQMNDLRRKAIAAATTPHKGAQNGQLTTGQLKAMRGLLSDDQAHQRGMDQNANVAESNRNTAQHYEATAGNNAARLDLDERKFAAEQFAKMPELQQAQIKSGLYQQWMEAGQAGDIEGQKAVAGLLQQLQTTGRQGSENLSQNFMRLSRPVYDANGNPTGVNEDYAYDLRSHGQQQPTQQQVTPPENHIAALRRSVKAGNQSEIDLFESRYGAGSAAMYLN